MQYIYHQKHRINVNDDVFIKHENGHQIAKILSFVGKRKEIMKVNLQWYERSCDIPIPKEQIPQISKHELFLSKNNYGIEQASCIDGLAKIVDIDTFDLTYDSQKDLFFTRATIYQSNNKVLFNPPIEKWKSYCICGKPHNPDNMQIQCDGCSSWYHPDCAKVNLSSDIEKMVFKCNQCKKYTNKLDTNPIRKKIKHLNVVSKNLKKLYKEKITKNYIRDINDIIELSSESSYSKKTSNNINKQCGKSSHRKPKQDQIQINKYKYSNQQNNDKEISKKLKQSQIVNKKSLEVDIELARLKKFYEESKNGNTIAIDKYCLNNTLSQQKNDFIHNKQKLEQIVNKKSLEVDIELARLKNFYEESKNGNTIAIDKYCLNNTSYKLKRKRNENY